VTGIVAVIYGIVAYARLFGLSQVFAHLFGRNLPAAKPRQI
jgi:hypothetical protein